MLAPFGNPIYLCPPQEAGFNVINKVRQPKLLDFGVIVNSSLSMASEINRVAGANPQTPAGAMAKRF
jgi:hypothetical protein